jgi:hypothetical protein
VNKPALRAFKIHNYTTHHRRWLAIPSKDPSTSQGMEATPEQAAEGQAIVRVLAAVLDRLVYANGSIAKADPGQITKFHAMKAPGIAIEQYLER